MEQQGDPFEPEYLSHDRAEPLSVRAYTVKRLQPIADELRRHGACPLAVAEGFAHFAGDFQLIAQYASFEDI